MTGEGDGTGKAVDEPEYKKWNVIVGTVGGILAILAAVHTLTGFNVFKEFGIGKPTPSAPVTSVPTPTWTVERREPSYQVKASAETVVTTTPARPEFHLRSSDWDGPCGQNWCSMSAIFRNYGGAGGASATFYVLRQDENTYLARCSVVLPATARNELTKVGCTASSPQLQWYFQTYRGATVRLDVRVDN